MAKKKYHSKHRYIGRSKSWKGYKVPVSTYDRRYQLSSGNSNYTSRQTVRDRSSGKAIKGYSVDPGTVIVPAIAGDGIMEESFLNSFSLTNLSAKYWEFQTIKDLSALVTSPTNTAFMLASRGFVNFSMRTNSANNRSPGTITFGIVVAKSTATLSTIETLGTASLQDAIKAGIDDDYRFIPLKTVSEQFTGMFYSNSVFYTYAAEGTFQLKGIFETISQLRRERETLFTGLTQPKYYLVGVFHGPDNADISTVSGTIFYNKKIVTLTS
jgi:hypothetical protein